MSFRKPMTPRSLVSMVRRLLTSWFGVVAALLVLAFSGVPAVAAAALAETSSFASGNQEEQLEEAEAKSTGARASATAVRRPKPAQLDRTFSDHFRRQHADAPPEATCFVPPQRKTLLRWLN
jgi:hypothetical protein